MSSIPRSKWRSAAPARPEWRDILLGFLGGTLGIGVLAWLALQSSVPLLIASFGASCVLLFAAHHAPLAQPRNVIGGHMLTTFIGLAAINMLGESLWVCAFATGLGIAAMQLLRVVHPPAGGNPLMITMAGMHSWSFLITPVLAGAIILVGLAWLLHRLRRHPVRWPIYWY